MKRRHKFILGDKVVLNDKATPCFRGEVGIIDGFDYSYSGRLLYRISIIDNDGEKLLIRFRSYELDHQKNGLEKALEYASKV